MQEHLSSDGPVEFQMSQGRWIRAIDLETPSGDIVAVRFDITDLKQAQIAADQANDAKSEFISVLSHELRTPLTVILGYAKLLRGLRPMDDRRQREEFVVGLADKIAKAGDHLLSLVNEILDFAKLSSEEAQIEVETLSLSDAIAPEIEMMRERSSARSIDLTYDVPPILVRADRRRLKQILLNLLSNALKFTRPGGRVVVSARAEGGVAVVTVSDDGDGIQEDKLDSIFEAFVQLERASTRQGGGTGLGLAITRKLVKLQGGEISVTSTPGEGSRFTFTLPMATLLDASLQDRVLPWRRNGVG